LLHRHTGKWSTIASGDKTCPHDSAARTCGRTRFVLQTGGKRLRPEDRRLRLGRCCGTITIPFSDGRLMYSVEGPGQCAPSSYPPRANERPRTKTKTRRARPRDSAADLVGRRRKATGSRLPARHNPQAAGKSDSKVRRRRGQAWPRFCRWGPRPPSGAQWRASPKSDGAPGKSEGGAEYHSGQQPARRAHLMFCAHDSGAPAPRLVGPRHPGARPAWAAANAQVLATHERPDRANWPRLGASAPAIWCWKLAAQMRSCAFIVLDPNRRAFCHPPPALSVSAGRQTSCPGPRAGGRVARVAGVGRS